MSWESIKPVTKYMNDEYTSVQDVLRFYSEQCEFEVDEYGFLHEGIL